MNMQKLLKQAQEMQDRLQRELVDTFADASVGGGMVSAKMNGHKQLLELRIDPELVDADDPGMLEDLIVAVVNEASRKMDNTLREKIGNMAASLPSLF